MSGQATLIKSTSITKQTLQAQAVNLDGAVLNQSIMPAIGDYQRDEGVIFPMLTKKYADAETIQEGVKENFPRVGAVNRSTLDHAAANVTNTPASLQRDLNDPGQSLKAISGEVSTPHFAQSMSAQQGHKFGDTFAENTDDMIKAGIRYLDRQLITGDADVNGDEFNGFLKLRSTHPRNADVTLDLTDTDNDELIHQALNRICIQAANEPNNSQRISHIFCSGGGLNAMINEVFTTHVNENSIEIAPGHKVRAIVTPSGKKDMTPLISSPFIYDERPDGVAYDIVDFWLLDMSCLEWHGLVPFGGMDSLDFQIFDFTQFVNGTPLTYKRMLLLYGTLYAKNRGRAIYRLRVRVRRGKGIIYLN